MNNRTKLLIEVPHNVLIEVTTEMLAPLLQAKLYDRDIDSYTEIKDKHLELLIVGLDKIGVEARESVYKKQSATYSRYWSEEREKTKKLQQELEELKKGN